MPATVLLLNWNGWRDTVECLESVLRLDWPELRVVVCDNASTDGSVERILAWARGDEAAPVPAHEALHVHVTPPVAKPIDVAVYERRTAEDGGASTGSAPQLVIIRTGGNLGFAGGYNVALRYLLARGEPGWAWLLNNDTVVAPDALTALVREAERDRQVGFVGSTLLDYHEPSRVVEAAGGRLVHWHGWTRPDAGPTAGPLDFVKGASMLCSIDTLRRVGLLDERYFLYSEDVDWCLAARRQGLRLAHAAGSRVWHKEGASSGHRSATHDYHSVKSALHLVRKHHPRLVPAAAAYSLVRCALPKLARGEWARLRAVGRGWRDFSRESAR